MVLVRASASGAADLGLIPSRARLDLDNERPKTISIFPLEIGEDQKKGLRIRRCCAFTVNSGEDQKNVHKYQ